jgi:hypothetical protein
MLIVSGLLILVYVFRDVGGVPVVAGLRGMVDDMVIGAAVLVTLRATQASKALVRINAAIAVLAVGLAVTGSLADSELLLQFANLSSSCLLVVVFVSLLAYVIRQTNVTGDTLFGALAVYLAVGCRSEDCSP